MIMDPEVYREQYLEPVDSAAAAPTASSLEGIFYLPDRCYYFDEKPTPYIHNFTFDNLTRQELLKLIQETGFGDTAGARSSGLSEWIEDIFTASEKQRSLVEHQELVLAAQKKELESLVHSRTYRFGKTVLSPLKVARRLWHALKSGVKRGQ
jgi:hypothetical protein